MQKHIDMEHNIVGALIDKDNPVKAVQQGCRYLLDSSSSYFIIPPQAVTHKIGTCYEVMGDIDNAIQWYYLSAATLGYAPTYFNLLSLMVEQSLDCGLPVMINDLDVIDVFNRLSDLTLTQGDNGMGAMEMIAIAKSIDSIYGGNNFLKELEYRGIDITMPIPDDYIPELGFYMYFTPVLSEF